MTTTQHLLISGRVQGVGFRFFVVKNAQEMQLTGWVRNLNDGRVEAVVQGQVSQLKLLLERLEEGPRLASVERMVIELVEEHKNMKEFSIREDGHEPCLFEL